MEYILETKHLEKKYKHFKAIQDLNIHVPKRSIYGLIGKNGAGKTTLIRLICGLQKPTNGSYKIYGVKNTEKEILDVRKRMGAIIETPSIRLEATAEDNLKEQYRMMEKVLLKNFSQKSHTDGIEKFYLYRGLHRSRSLENNILRKYHYFPVLIGYKIWHRFYMMRQKNGLNVKKKL